MIGTNPVHAGRGFVVPGERPVKVQGYSSFLVKFNEAELMQ
jgi:hypothetical protein